MILPVSPIDWRASLSVTTEPKPSTDPENSANPIFLNVI
jgi:hypothetical protein